MAFPLHPGTPEEGKTLEELFKDRDVDIDQVMAHLKQVASGLGLPFGDRKRTYNSRLAQELGKWAESRDKGHEFHNAMFRAYFVDGQNIGKADVLIEVAESINLNGKDAHKVIQGRTYKEAVDSDRSAHHGTHKSSGHRRSYEKKWIYKEKVNRNR